MASRRILILINRIPYPLTDGGALAMNAMLEGYHKAGWKVHLLAMNTTRHWVGDEVLTRLYPYLDGFTTVPVDNALRTADTIRNFLFSREPNHAARFRSDAFQQALVQVLQSFHPEMVQLESLFLATYLPLIRQYSSAKLILRMHNVEWQIWKRLAGKTKNPIKRIYLQDLARRMERFERHVWPQFDLILPITDKDAAVAAKVVDAQRLYVVPFGIDVEQNSPQPITPPWKAYHLAAMDWLANQEAAEWFIKEIWPVARLAVPDMPFYFAGHHMPDRILQLGDGNLHVEGAVSDADIFRSDKNILLVPLRSGGGIRVKILEAMAMGKIVVSTDVGIQGIEAKEGIHYLKANTPEAFAEAFKWITTHPTEATQIGENAQRLIIDSYNQAQVMGNLLLRLEQLAVKSS